ncbi:VirK/YbjX family protein [Citrobacter freundii]|uniref:VirK/YbjX family protein n=1 Tax=Citrobacter freundii TaxID=546 RepID=UPI002433E501|nr:VirK/YbjX family protein [Citrobacter freundii]WFW61895.1 VirK/YbjX family protein [Citrobacter freundii]
MSQLTKSTFLSSKPVSSFNLFYNLSRGQLRPGQCWDQRSFRRKFIWRSLLIPHLTREWMTELAQWPELDSLLTLQPRLPVRLHRPYLALNLDRKMKLDAVRFHYNFIRHSFSSAELNGYLSPEGLQLAQIEGKEGELFTLVLTALITLDKEGESTLLLRNSVGETLAEITFTICEYEEKATVFIGGLQGGSRLLPHEAIQKATKSCHGIFPKRIVMEAICRLAERLNIENVMAVSNEQHIFRSPRYHDKNKVILSDYNAFWASVGGECDSRGYYHIPRTLARKSESEIASKKRAEYRRRYQLLDTIHEQLSLMFRH